MSIIPEEFIKDLVDKSDVVDVVGDYVKLKKSGTNFMGICPFHNEKTPSFSVNSTKQFYKCFGCQKAGDSLTFLKDFLNLSFVEAVEELAKKVGVEVPRIENNQNNKNPPTQEEKIQKEIKITTLYKVLFHSQKAFLNQKSKIQDYLNQRNLSEEIIQIFGLGFTPNEDNFLAKTFKDYQNPLLIESGMVLKTENGKLKDRFFNRLMFPIKNVNGQIIAFGGRVLNDFQKPKYLNSPETEIFSKSRELYGLFEVKNFIKDFNFVLITEGYMDVISLFQAGFKNSVATLGTACTTEQIKKIFRFTNNLIFSFDGDSAGKNAANRALTNVLPFVKENRQIKFLFLPENHDPDSFIKSFGKENFETQIKNSKLLEDFLLEIASKNCDLDSFQGKSLFSNQVKELWNLLPSGTFKSLILSEVAKKIDLDEKVLFKIWKNKKFISSEDYFVNFSKKNNFRNQRNLNLPKLPKFKNNENQNQVLRILFSKMEFLSRFDNDDFQVLSVQADPYGKIFVWLETYYLDNGIKTWQDLSLNLDSLNSEKAEFVENLMKESKNYLFGTDEDLFLELRSILNLWLKKYFSQNEKKLLEGLIIGNEEAQERLLILQKRRTSLDKI